jgi:hypothetical protein
MQQPVNHQIAGLVIGQAFENSGHEVVRVVTIDPEMRCVESEDPAGAFVVDDIEHFRATHHLIALPLVLDRLTALAS